MALTAVRTVYLSGGITDVDGYARQFAVAAAVLRGDGYDVVSPVELDDPVMAKAAQDNRYGAEYEALLARDLEAIEGPGVDAVFVLPGWEHSRGACREVETARRCGKPVLAYPGGEVVDHLGDYETTTIRTFGTGATRDTDEGKPDYEGYLSPAVLAAFGRYMLRHSTQPDGQVRASDNWQKGIPLPAYMKSAFRHFVDWWTIHRNDRQPVNAVDVEEAVCALIFNACGYLHEHLKDAERERIPADSCGP